MHLHLHILDCIFFIWEYNNFFDTFLIRNFLFKAFDFFTKSGEFDIFKNNKTISHIFKEKNGFKAKGNEIGGRAFFKREPQGSIIYDKDNKNLSNVTQRNRETGYQKV